MLDYLEKFKLIAPEIRTKISNPQTVAEIKRLDDKYQLDMGSLVIRLMIKDLRFDHLVDYLVTDLNFPRNKAQDLQQELQTKIFPGLLDYLEIKSAAQPTIPVKPTPQQGLAPEVKEIKLNSQPEVKPTVAPVASQLDETEVKIEKVISKTNIKFSSQMMESRFKQILRTYLKGVRSRIDTRNTILKPFDVGGLGLDEKSAENILSMLNDENQPGQTKVKAPARIKVPEDRKDFARQVAEYNLAAAVKDKPVLKQSETAVPALSPIKLAPVVPEVISQPVMQQPIQPIIHQPIIKPAPKRPPITKVEFTGSGKIKMDDIKAAPKVLTPVDELRYMTMRNFRQLNPDPNRRIEIIMEKLELFREQDYSKKVAGIQAWKASPVNQAYVNILKSSISNGRPISAVIAEQLKQNQGFMSQEEFDVIVKLNRQLYY